MKTERRHELQTNELADWLGTTILFIENNYRTVLGVIVALVVVVGAAFYLKSESATRKGQAWDRYFQAQQAQDPLNEMLTVAENYDGTAAASWAKLTVADNQLAMGADQLFRDRAEANNQLRKAAINYEEISKSSLAVNEPLLQQRAIFGLARTYESLGELDKAKAEYARLADKSQWPHLVFAIEAERRLKSLDQPSTKAFYDWFARQETKPPETAPGSTPIDLNQLPDESAFESSSVAPESTSTDAGASTPAVESTETATPPATEPAPTDGATPAATEPSGETPAAADAAAEPAAPAAEQPPAEQPPSTP